MCSLPRLTDFPLTSPRGVANSFGVFQPYFTTLFERSPSDISWIGSFEVFLLFFVGTFTGRWTDTGYFRPLFVVGFFLVVLGMVAASFCTTYWQFFLAQGICLGLGNGCLFCPTMAVTSTYFAKRRSLAFGLTAAGATVGGLAFPSMVRQLLPQIGLAWTIRAIALIQFVTLIVAGLLIKTRIPPRTAAPLVEWAAFKESEYAFYAVGAFMVSPLGNRRLNKTNRKRSVSGASTLPSTTSPPSPATSLAFLIPTRWTSFSCSTAWGPSAASSPARSAI